MDSALEKASRGAKPSGDPRRRRLSWGGDHEQGIANKITNLQEAG